MADQNPQGLKSQAVYALQNEMSRAEVFMGNQKQAFHDRVYVPARTHYSHAANVWPLPTLFLTVLFTLAFLPCLLFMGFATVVGLFLLFGAMAWFAVIVGTASILFGIALLVCTGIAIALTAWLTGLYLVYRLFINIRDEDMLGDAFRATLDDARGLLYNDATERYISDNAQQIGVKPQKME